MEPDVTAITGIRSKDTKVGSPRFNTAWLRSTELWLNNLVEGVSRKPRRAVGLQVNVVMKHNLGD